MTDMAGQALLHHRLISAIFTIDREPSAYTLG